MLDLENVQEHRELGLSDDQVIDMYRKMVLARKIDDRMWALNRQGRVPFVVSASGHEATQVGAAFAIDTSKDWSLPYYRDMAFAVGVGVTAADIFLSLFAKATDPASAGRQMPGHFSEPNLKIFTHGSVIATQFPHACGIAYELQRAGSEGVVMVASGDGATSEGDWHEAMNFASIKKLPVIFLVENNLYAISTPSAEEIAGVISDRAQGYNMPGVNIDGNDIFAVYGAMSTAVERARKGDGPTLVEAKTYRYYAHTSDDDDKLYRDPEEVAYWRRRDPITRLEQYLIENRLLDEGTEQDIHDEAAEMVARGLAVAEEAPEMTDPFSHVYAKPIEPTEPVALEAPMDGEVVNLITAINRTLHEILASYPEALIFGQDIADPKGGVFKTTKGLTDAFGGDRAFNAPLAESLIIGIGIGMAAIGSRPIAEIQFADFIHPAFDQIVSEAARISYRSGGRWNCPLVIRVPYGGGIRGGLYHSQSVEAFYTHVPGLKVVVPSTPADAKGLLWAAIEDPDPVLFLEPKKLYRLAKGPYPAGEHSVPLGKAALRREGDDLTIIAYGTMAHYAMEAAEQLSQQGISAGVLDLRSLRPLDWPSIEAAVHRNGKVLVVHEDNEFMGFGAEIVAQINDKAFDWLDAPVRRYAGYEIPSFPYSEQGEAMTMLSVVGIIEAAQELARY
ncbi:MAG: tungsten formylmethanofuran dehydrogenase [Acidobacteria bacterium]|nr:tungsten formylmethanofuran dehydrogenase [Acidobacteriota bacterium]